MRKSFSRVAAMAVLLAVSTASTTIANAAEIPDIVEDVPSDSKAAFIDFVEQLENFGKLSEDKLSQMETLINQAQASYVELENAGNNLDSEVVNAKKSYDTIKAHFDVVKTLTASTADRQDMLPIESLNFGFNSSEFDTITTTDATTKEVLIFNGKPLTAGNATIDFTKYTTVGDLPFDHKSGSFGYEIPDFTTLWDAATMQQFYKENNLSGEGDTRLDPTNPAYDSSLVRPTGSIGRPLDGWVLDSVVIDGEEYRAGDNFIFERDIDRGGKLGHVLSYNYRPAYEFDIVYDLAGGNAPSGYYKNMHKYSILRNDTVQIEVPKLGSALTNTPSKSGYDFIGWTVDGATELKTDTFDLSVQAGKTYTIKANYVAKSTGEDDPGTGGGEGDEKEEWTPTVIYHSNIAGEADKTVVKSYSSTTKNSYNTSAAISQFVPPTGAFLYWSDSPVAGAGTIYRISDSIQLTRENPTLDLYAIWSTTDDEEGGEWTATINYVNNIEGAEEVVQPVTETIKSGTETTLRASTNNWFAVPSGKKFSGWNTKADGTGTKYAQAATITVTKAEPTLTLYAIWEDSSSSGGSEEQTDHWEAEIVYVANISGNSSIANVSSKTTVASGDSYVFTASTCGFTSSTSKTFKEWNTKADGTGTSYKPGADVSVTKTSPKLTLYAIWTDGSGDEEDSEWTATIQYDLNEGTGSMSEQTATSKEKKQELTVVDGSPLKRDGYSFKDWNTKKDGSGTSYAKDSKITIEKDSPTVTLYAQWNEEKWTATIKYNVNGGTGSITETTGEVTSGDSTKLKIAGIGDVKNEGKTFASWNTKADGSGTKYDANAEVEIKKDDPTLELFAIWTNTAPWKLTVKYNANGGTGTMEDQTEDVSDADEKEITIAKINGISRDGYTFDGWNTTSDGKGTKYAPDQKVKIKSDSPTLELFAQWITNEEAAKRAEAAALAANGSGSNGADGETIDNVQTGDHTGSLPALVTGLSSLAGVAFMLFRRMRGLVK